jgi:hypothetical protein
MEGRTKGGLGCGDGVRKRKVSGLTTRTAAVVVLKGAVFDVGKVLANFNHRNLLTCYSPPPVVVQAKNRHNPW